MTDDMTRPAERLSPSDVCETCRFFEPHKRERTRLELWNADTRPDRPKGFIGAMRWFWDPNQFRDSPPSDDDMGPFFDRMIEIRNRSGRCFRFPKSVNVDQEYWCGEYLPKAPNDQ